MEIIRLNKDNYKDYPKQIYELGESIKEYNSANNLGTQFFGTSEAAIISYINSEDAEVIVAIDENAKVIGYNFVNLNVKQNTHSDYTKYFHSGIDYKNHLANSFSDINAYNEYVTKEYLTKILMFAKAANEITSDPNKNANGFNIKEFIENQVANDTFYENNFLRRSINLRMYELYQEQDKISDFSQIFYYGIADVDKDLLRKMYADMGGQENLDELISNYELFLQNGQPKYLEETEIDKEKYYDVEQQNSLELNTYAVDPNYRSQGLPKILLYESLKAVFEKYFIKEENNEIYLIGTIHNDNTSSQNVVGAFKVNDYLYVERWKNQNRRVYINKVSIEEFRKYIYDMALELLILYNYNSDNFGFDLENAKEKVIAKIEQYTAKMELAIDSNSQKYYEAKVNSLNELLEKINTKQR